MKIQFKIIFIFSLFTVLIVLSINLLEYFFLNKNSFDDFYKRLEIRAIVAARTKFAEDELNKSTYENIRKQHLEKLPNEKEYFIPITSHQDSFRLAISDFDSVFIREALTTGQSRFRDHDIFYLARLYTSKNKSYITILSAKNEFLNKYLSNLKTVLIVGLALTLLLAILFGVLFSKIILAPIRNIVNKMKDITANQLYLRIDHHENDTDEIATLANTFNDMLNRLEIAFETQKNFISNASHELKTPLTSIIGESELALYKKRDDADYKSALENILLQAERLKNITDTLLYIAETGFKGKKLILKDIRIDEKIYNAKKRMDSMIPENKIKIDFSLMPEDVSLLTVKGNRELLESAFVNILVNACKYSDNDEVFVTLAATNDTIIIIVEDVGIGIPADELAYIYDPFFRASNTKGKSGYGIGLPLSRNIIKLHHGEFHVESEENVGTRVKIILPNASHQP